MLLGDTAHAMAFYLSMGISLAIEDATALATALELHTSSPGTTPLAEALSLFEKVRNPRTEKIRDASLHAGAMLHLPPGRERDLQDKSAKNDHAVIESGEGDPLLNWISYGITDKTSEANPMATMSLPRCNGRLEVTGRYFRRQNWIVTDAASSR